MTFFSQHRKLGFNIILITQSDRMLDKQIRSLVEDEVKHALDDNPALEVAEESEHEESDFNESAEDMQLADYGSEDEIPSYRLEARNHSASDTYYEPVAVDSSSTLLETLISQLA